MFSQIFSLRAVVVSSMKITKAVAASKQCSIKISTYKPPVCKPSSAANRRFYSQKPETMTVDYDYVKKASLDNNVLIIDVREPDEVKEYGKIPNSVNIPLGNVTTALDQLSEKQFASAYQRPKPLENTEIIFYCMIGKRSGMAQENAQKLGFKNAKNYLGSFTDWSNKNKS